MPTRRDMLARTGALLLGAGVGLPLRAARAAVQPSTLRLVDVHRHCIPHFWLDEARAAVAAQLGGEPGPQWTGWSIEQSVEQMDHDGIVFALLSVTAPGTWFGEDRAARRLARRCNEFMAQAAAAHPHRLGVHATLPLPDVTGSLAELRYALDVLHADGIGLFTSYQNRWLGDPAFEPLMQALDERHAVVFVHPLAPQCCTHLLPAVTPNFTEFLQDTDRAILNLMFTGTLRRHPNIRFVFCHGGGTLPMLSGRIQALLPRYPQQAAEVPGGFARSLARLHFDITNTTTRPALSAVLAAIPVSQLLFGTDSPIVPIAATMRGLVPGLLSSADIVAIAHGNAVRLYPSAAAALAA